MNKEWEAEKERLFEMLPGGNHAGYRNYWNTVFSIAVQSGVANKMLAYKYRRTQRENYKSSGGYPIGDVDYLTDLGYGMFADCLDKHIMDPLRRDTPSNELLNTA
jgi:hypothetical protein